MKKSLHYYQHKHAPWMIGVLLTLCLYLLPEIAFSQSYSNSNPVRTEQLEKDNDYYIKYRTSLPNHYSHCGGVSWEENRPMQKKDGSWQRIGESVDGWGTRTVTVAAFPYATLCLGGEYWTGSHLFNCLKWSTSGKWMTAAKLKQPYNFGILYEEEQKRVILRWKNATNVPNDKYKIKIKRTNLNDNTVKEIQVDGGTTNYTDTRDIKPGKEFKYEIWTYFPGGYSSTYFNNCPSRSSTKVDKNVTLDGIINNFEIDTRRNSIQFKWGVRNTVYHDIIRLEYKDGTEWSLVEELSATTDQYTWSPSFALIPGDVYEFRIRAMKGLDEIQQLSDDGYLSPNGVLSGHVKIADSEKGVPEVPLKLVSVPDGKINYQYYRIPGTLSVDELNNIDKHYECTKKGTVSNINIDVRDRNTTYALSFNTWIYIKEEGSYTFYLRADDLATINIDKEQWLEATYINGEKSVSRNLTKGFHKLNVNFAQYYGDHHLSVKYSGPGIEKQEIPTDNLYSKKGIEKLLLTDQEGYFYLDEIYYGEESEFYIIPTKEDADIRPDTITRTLSLSDYKQDDVRFQDHSSIPVYGKVLIGDCPIKDASVVFNGEEQSTKTKEDGSFEYIIQSPDPTKDNTLGVSYKKHEFDQTVTLDLATDTKNKTNPFVFHDIQKDTLILSVFSGCNKPIADEADVELFRVNESGGNCYSEIVTLDATGIATLYLPAAKYKAKVVDLRITKEDATDEMKRKFKEVKQNLIDAMGEKSIDLTQRDTIKVKNVEVINAKTGETKVTNKVTEIRLIKAPFRFRQDIELTLEGDIWKTPTAVHDVTVDNKTISEEVFVLEQGEKYSSKIKLNEKYDYYPILKHKCGVETATLMITDNVSDRAQKERTIVDGTLEYEIKAGDANIKGPWNKPRGYQKNISVTARVPEYKKELFTQKWALVTGHKILEPTFITAELHLPDFILHDPPGDNSYAYLEKGTTITTGIEYKGANAFGVDFGTSLEALLFKGFGLKSTAGLYNTVNSLEGSGEEKKDLYTTVLKQKVTTCNDLTGTNEDADVVFGTGMNFVYSKSKQLSFDGTNPPAIDDSYTVSPGFKTRYVLSIYHVKTHIIPTIDNLLKEIENQKQRQANGETLTKKELYLILNEDILNNSKNNWKKIIADNKRNIFLGGTPLNEKESSIANLTLNGGNTYDYEYSVDTLKTRNKTTHWEVSTKTGINFLFETELVTFKLNVGLATNHTKDNTTVHSTVTNVTQGFHLGDSSAGDFFTMNVTKDPTYGTYMFQTVSGTSSCPNEPGTQARDRVKMTVVSNPELRNLPQGKSAVYKVRLDNDSQSEEGRIYSVNTLTGQESGATVKVGGKKISGLGSSFPIFLPYQGSNEVTVEVIPGPGTSSLPIELVAMPGCMTDIYKTEDLRSGIEAELEKVPADASKVTLFASWESNCDPISIESPSDNWVVNTCNDNELPLTLTGFDPNSSDLSSLEVEYRKAGDLKWKRFSFIGASQIGDFPKKHLSLRVDTMDAGRYFIRANAYCTDLNVKNYSNVISGVIDHNPFVSIDTNIEDGWLREDNLIVEFSKDLASSKVRIERINKEKTEIYEKQYVDATVQGHRAFIHIPEADQYEGFTYRVTFVTADTRDMEGELLTRDQSYIFVLDRAAANWQERNKVAIIVKGETSEINAKLRNRAAHDVRFNIVSNSLSNFITPQVSTGTVPANGNFPVIFDVNELETLPVGRFKGQVIVRFEEDGKSYRKNLEIELIVKAKIPEIKQPEAKRHQMHMVAQFTPSANADLPISEDEQDFIVAYIDGEVAGVSKLFFDNTTNKCRAYLTIESDNSENKVVTFKMWDNSRNTMYVAKEKTSYRADAIEGTNKVPFLLHSQEAEQFIVLTQGWNFVSFNVNPANRNINNVLATLTQDESQIKQLTTGFSAYNPSTKQWSGAISEIDINKGYKIYVPQDDLLKVRGTLLKDEYSVSIDEVRENKYNWVAVHNNEAIEIDKAINKAELKGGEVLRHNDRFAILESDKSSWSGDLSLIEPGMGYELYNPTNIDVVDQTIASKLRFNAEAKFVEESPSDLKAHIVIGGDTGGRYYANPDGSFPGALYDHSFVIPKAGTAKISIDLDEAGITPDEFMNNPLIFFVRSDSYLPALKVQKKPEVRFENCTLEVLDNNNQVVFTYDYSALMTAHTTTEYSHNWSNQDGFLKWKKSIVNATSHKLLVAQNSEYVIPNRKSRRSRKSSYVENDEKEIISRNTMTVISKSYLNGEELNSDDYTIEAKVVNEVLGRNYLNVEDSSSKRYQFLMLKENNETTDGITFELTDHTTGKKYKAKQTLDYTNDQRVGSISSPLHLEFGMDKGSIENNVHVYPNPISKGNKCYVQIKKTNEQASLFQVKVIDINGQLIHQSERSNQRFDIDTQNWSIGVYFLSVYQGKTVIGTSKIIIK